MCVCCCFVAGCYINLTGRGGPVAARRTAQQARAGYLPATKMVLMLRSRSFSSRCISARRWFWVRTALFRNVQQAVAAQQIEDHVTFRRAELAGFLHSDAARFFAFQQPLDFSCSE